MEAKIKVKLTKQSKCFGWDIEVDPYNLEELEKVNAVLAEKFSQEVFKKLFGFRKEKNNNQENQEDDKDLKEANDKFEENKAKIISILHKEKGATNWFSKQELLTSLNNTLSEKILYCTLKRMEKEKFVILAGQGKNTKWVFPEGKGEAL